MLKFETNTNVDDLIKLITEEVPSQAESQPNDREMIEEPSKYGMQYDRRDHLYTALLENYIDIYKAKSIENKIYKRIFFALTMFIFVGLIVTSTVILFIVAGKSKTSVADIALIISGISGVITAIIALPRIIAEHLFPTTEEAHMIDMVKNMQQNDSGIRNSVSEQSE